MEEGLRILALALSEIKNRLLVEVCFALKVVMFWEDYSVSSVENRL